MYLVGALKVSEIQMVKIGVSGDWGGSNSGKMIQTNFLEMSLDYMVKR